VLLDDGERARVATAKLHALDASDSDPSAAPRRVTVPPRPGSVQVPVGELLAWLERYQEENNVDLLVRKVNGGRSRRRFVELVGQLAAAATVGQSAAAAPAGQPSAPAQLTAEEQAAAATLAQCQQEQQEQPAGSPMSE